MSIYINGKEILVNGSKTAHMYMKFLCLPLILLLAACGHPPSSGKQVFRYNVQEGIASLDPAFAKNQAVIWAVKQLYNTLVEPDDQLNIRPSLATRWEVTSDA